MLVDVNKCTSKVVTEKYFTTYLTNPTPLNPPHPFVCSCSEKKIVDTKMESVFCN